MFSVWRPNLFNVSLKKILTVGKTPITISYTSIISRRRPSVFWTSQSETCLQSRQMKSCCSWSHLRMAALAPTRRSTWTPRSQTSAPLYRSPPPHDPERETAGRSVNYKPSGLLHNVVYSIFLSRQHFFVTTLMKTYNFQRCPGGLYSATEGFLMKLQNKKYKMKSQKLHEITKIAEIYWLFSLFFF